MSASDSSKAILDYGYYMMELWTKQNIGQHNIDDRTFQWAMDMALKHYKVEKEADTQQQVWLFKDRDPSELEKQLEQLEKEQDE